MENAIKGLSASEKGPFGVFFLGFTQTKNAQNERYIANPADIALHTPMKLRLLIPAVALLLAGCEIPGMGPDPKAVQREADAKAIGGACRLGLRSIEDCYILNEKASKADMFTGWKDMDLYMRENKIEGIRATAVKVEPPPPPPEEVIIEEPKPKAGKKAASH